MTIFKYNTRKGEVIIKYVFESKEEYDLILQNLKIATAYQNVLDCKDLEDKEEEKERKEEEDITTLFEEYFNPKDSYYDNKPTVTVFENHLITIAWQTVQLYRLSLLL